MSARRHAYFLLLLVAIIWGIAPPVIKYSLPYFPVSIFLTYRFLIITLVMVPYLLVKEPQTWHILGELKGRDWYTLLLSATFGSTLQLGLLFWGLELTTSLDGSIINATSPILVALACHFLLKEYIPRREVIGHVIAFIGSLIIVIQPLFEGQKLFSGSVAGNFLTLMGTVAWVVYVLLTKSELKHKLSPLLLTTVMFFVGLVSMSVISLFQYSPYVIQKMLITAPVSAHLGVLFMAVFSGAIAYWAYQAAQKIISAAEANIFLYLPPIFTLPLAFFWLHENISLFFVFGSLIIALGVFVAEFSRNSRRHVV